MNFEQAFGFDTSNWPVAFLAFLRILTIVFFLPLFGSEATPTRIRIVLSLAMTFATWSVIETHLAAHSETVLAAARSGALSMAVITLREVFFGFAIGFSTKLVMFGANIAANAIGVNMGFQTAGTLSPIFAAPDSVLSNFKNWIILVLMLSLNIHHHFVELIFNSFKSVPIAHAANASVLLSGMIELVQTGFEFGIRIAAPLLAIQVITTVSLGLLGRLVPQLNVFIVNFPVSYLISMLILFFGMSSLVAFIAQNGFRDQMYLTNNALSSFEKRP